MPAKDVYHDVVVRALEKEGWSVDEEQVRLIVPNRQLFIDLRARKSEGNTTDDVIILVEVKSFVYTPSIIEYVSGAIGKYVIYRTVLQSQNITYPLYMAVPQSAYDGIWSESIGRLLLRDLEIQLIVFDVEQEIITQWHP